MQKKDVKRNNRQKKSGFADTAKFPHKGHPANYRHTSRNEIEYITFTHTSDVVKINNKEHKVIPLTNNIETSVRKKEKKLPENQRSKSYVYPKKFIGPRSALRSERYDLSFTPEDKKIVDKLFQELPVEHPQYSRKKILNNKKSGGNTASGRKCPPPTRAQVCGRLNPTHQGEHTLSKNHNTKSKQKSQPKTTKTLRKTATKRSKKK